MNEALRIYSAGAVTPPLQDAVRVFEEQEGIKCRITPGKPESLLKAIRHNKKGDIISCGAEYVHDEAEDTGVLVKGTRRSLGCRRSVIVVESGNPKGIESVEDLCRDGIRMGIAVGGCLKGVWDDICSKAGLIDEIRGNIIEHADACGTLMGLIHGGRVDAVFGWNAFKNVWQETCDIVELPRDIQVFRSTAVQVITYTEAPDLSAKLIEFLTSTKGREIYSRFGWVHGKP